MSNTEREELPEVAVPIPPGLLKEFRASPRFVVKRWLVGIPVPIAMLKEDFVEQVAQDFEVYIVPKELAR